MLPLLFAIIPSASLSAQTAAPAATHVSAAAHAAPPTLPALFLSDIHLDPFIDPTKAVALNAAPASQWSSILAAPAGPALTPAQQSSFAACYDGPDTSYALWQSTLTELKKTATSSRFVVISGDLLAHKFDCKYRALVPTATAASYLDFTAKTVDYILSTLHTALPDIPIYTALGNNDSGCVDYALDATRDGFLARLAPLVASLAQLTPATRTSAEHDFAALGSFSAPLAPLPHTRVLVLDDLFFSAKYVTCAGSPDPAPAAAALAWLNAQLASARTAHDRVWVVGHIPPGVDLYATARKLTNVCGGKKPTMFLGSEALAETLAANADIIPLALFGHTHDDELRLLAPESASTAASHPQSLGVPLKVVSSITPVHGNRPTFTLAKVDPSTSTLIDYTVIKASDPTQSPIAWSPEYTYSTAYSEPAFDPASLTALIAGFQADPAAKTSASQSYLRAYFPSDGAAATDNAAVISAAWQPYACSLTHDSAKSFAACACTK